MKDITEVCYTLVKYKLNVQLYNEDKTELVKQVNVTLINFSGWPDLDCPSTEDELEGFHSMLETLVGIYVNSKGKDKPKAVMHCRQGHGRTGTCTLILSRILQKFYGTFSSHS